MPTKLSFTDQIRKCIDGCGMTRYAIGVGAGIDHATISRFMNGKGGLSMEVLDAIAGFIGMHAELKGMSKPAGASRRKSQAKG
ncbi:MAG TPA: helix-turn-helix transcriptional regulator [Phycisphaerae bacterium]|nr:helix-turn-helix transcriptional regulator [Phycisphaerae bacterium]HOQ88159.1 helix-turn-helix transcriptional regulator [Phycisphaerae bacterium]HQE29956.1 helix-turn-helix transcriptional regulator [Phycisphaerae bacterium]